MLLGWLVGFIALTIAGERFYAQRAATAPWRRAHATFALATAVTSISLVLAAQRAARKRER